MKHRTHDHLFAAAGVTAALSLIGTGATVLKGSVFHFDHWPLVAGDSARDMQLPTAPIAVDEAQPQTAREALLAGATRVGGTAALLPGLGGPTGISAIGTTIPAPSAGTTSGATAVGLSGSGSAGTGGSNGPASSRVVAQDGFGYDLGPAPSSSVDGSRDPAGSTGAAGSTRTAPNGADTDGDGIPDTWEKDHGSPAAPSDTTAGGTTGTSDGRDPTTASAFTADPPADTKPTDATPPADTTTPPPADVPSDQHQDPAPPDTTPPTDTTTPPADPAPADPAPTPDPPADPAPADPAPPAEPAPPADPAPADPAPPADPPPADPPPAPPAETTPPPAPAETAPPASDTSNGAVASANAAIPASVQ